MDGRWWANDANCLIVGPEVEWARHVKDFTGLRGSSDRLLGLDVWGVEIKRQLLSRPAPAQLI